MSDDRLFAAKNAIGRKWYWLNTAILAVITLVTHFVFNNFILPNVESEEYQIIASWVMYFIFFIYFITFLSLIDRRLYDVCGARDNAPYKISSSVIFWTVVVLLFLVYCWYKNPELPFSYDIITAVSVVLGFISCLIAFVIGFLKGKITSKTLKPYADKKKYGR